jgi:uncharacterized membrane protein
MLNVMFVIVMAVFIFVYMIIIINADERDRARRDFERRNMDYIKNSESKLVVKSVKDKDNTK